MPDLQTIGVLTAQSRTAASAADITPIDTQRLRQDEAV